MTRLDLSLYLVTDRALAGQRGVVETVRAAVAGGVTVVQLRDPEVGGRELYGAALELREVLRDSGVPLIVNDRLDVALAAGADGVHLGQSDLPPERARAIAGPGFCIGWSTGTPAEVALLRELPAGTVDYVGIGPVIETPTKPDAGPGIGIDELRRVRAGTELPAVAIGGITATNAAAVAATGVQGICCVSAICAAADPRLAAAELRAMIAPARHASRTPPVPGVPGRAQRLGTVAGGTESR